MLTGPLNPVLRGYEEQQLSKREMAIAPIGSSQLILRNPLSNRSHSLRHQSIFVITINTVCGFFLKEPLIFSKNHKDTYAFEHLIDFLIQAVHSGNRHLLCLNIAGVGNSRL